MSEYIDFWAVNEDNKVHIGSFSRSTRIMSWCRNAVPYGMYKKLDEHSWTIIRKAAEEDKRLLQGQMKHYEDLINAAKVLNRPIDEIMCKVSEYQAELDELSVDMDDWNYCNNVINIFETVVNDEAEIYAGIEASWD